MNDLRRFVALIVQPTLEDFRRNPHSVRHYYLAATALFHCVDRVARARGKRPKQLRDEWRLKSKAFARVDVIAHDFKHVRADARLSLPPLVPHAPGLLGNFALSTTVFNDTGQMMALTRSLDEFDEAIAFIKLEGGIR